MSDDDIPFKVVGMGFFPLPGERKRHRKAMEDTRRMLRQAEEAKQRGDDELTEREEPT